MSARVAWVAAVALLASGAGCRARPPAHPLEYVEFQHPERVAIANYSGDAMEPFLTRDGHYLLFNNRNDPKVNTNLHYAERIDDLHFAYRGEIQGVNTDALEGVPSLSCDGMLYFVSTRSYKDNFSTIYRAHFSKGVATEVELAPGVSRKIAGRVNFDGEISADGDTLYAVDSHFKNAMPASADIFMARRRGNGFERLPESADLLKLVNTKALEYAPAISSDGLELFFTRVEKITAGAQPRIWRASRKSTRDPFGEPQLVSAIIGFAEGPTISPDGLSLYYHAREHDRFVIFRVTRPREPGANIAIACPAE
jgi:WD40-like Beta Propeller Repeat